MPALPHLANAVASGILTGTVYGLMALGLSAIFGVIRLVNFAHGELMTLAMYAAVVAFQGLALDPFLTMIGRGGRVRRLRLRAAARLHQSLRPTAPSTPRCLLMIALAMILGNALLARLRARRAQRPDRATSSIRSSSGRCSLDKVRVYAAGAAAGATALLAAFFRLTLTGKAIRACADNPSARASRACPSRTSTPSPSVSAPPRSRWPAARWCRSST